MNTTSQWLEIDVLGLRRTLERKGLAWAVFELVQNAWDADGTTEVNVTLTKPKNGIATLRCEDNASDGYRNTERKGQHPQAGNAMIVDPGQPQAGGAL
jgi:hypothetical protein